MSNNPQMRKRSVEIGGFQTSFCAEDVFWEALKRIAEEKGMKRSQFIAQIAALKPKNLSSTLRVVAMEHFLEKDDKAAIPAQAARLAKGRASA